MKKAFVFLFAFALATPSFAQLVFSPGVTYTSQEVEATQGVTANSESTMLRADLRLGYILPMGLYLGGMYAHESGESGGSDLTGSLMGPTVGFHSMMGFYGLLTYHIMGEKELATNFSVTGAKGPQVDIGWVFPVTSMMSIGPQLTWRSVEYEEFDAAGVTGDTDYSETSIAPYISLWFMF